MNDKDSKLLWEAYLLEALDDMSPVEFVGWLSRIGFTAQGKPDPEAGMPLGSIIGTGLERKPKGEMLYQHLDKDVYVRIEAPVTFVGQERPSGWAPWITHLDQATIIKVYKSPDHAAQPIISWWSHEDKPTLKEVYSKILDMTGIEQSFSA